MSYEFLFGILATLSGIFLGILYFIFRDYGYKFRNLISEKTQEVDMKMRQDINGKILNIENEVSEIKDNYIQRFDEQKDMLHKLDIKITEMGNEIYRRMTYIEGQIELIKNELKHSKRRRNGQ